MRSANAVRDNHKTYKLLARRELVGPTKPSETETTGPDLLVEYFVGGLWSDEAGEPGCFV